MFIDEVKILIYAGNGGDGCTSFRHEKYVEMGGPNGGNGGHGASVIFRVDGGLRTLIDLKMQKTIKAPKGENGKGSNMNGANSDDIIVKVPSGTTIINAETDEVMADLLYDGEEVVVAHGGRGGRGNRAFATHENPAPRMSELGEPGEKITLKCELKVLADVGLVGMPSVGKSTLINQITHAHAKTGAYHFTTINPNLGVVKYKGKKDFILADLPGLIEGAAEGVGLGIKFLKHAARTKVIAHVIDISGSEGRDPIEDFEIIKKEMKSYDEKLINKPYVILLNKCDLEGSKENIEKFRNKYKDEKIFEISALNNEGLDSCVEYLADLVEGLEDVKLYDDIIKESHILYKYEQEKPFKIEKGNNIWILSGPEVEKLFYMTRFEESESVERFGRKLRGMGVEDELSRLGAQRGDEVKILDYIFIFDD